MLPAMVYLTCADLFCLFAALKTPIFDRFSLNLISFSDRHVAHEHGCLDSSAVVHCRVFGYCVKNEVGEVPTPITTHSLDK